jgi:hypothetical protein
MTHDRCFRRHHNIDRRGVMKQMGRRKEEKGGKLLEKIGAKKM